MAGFSDTVNVTIDIATSKAGAALGDLKGKMSAAAGQGGIGGLKSAAAGLGDTLGAMPIPALIGAAGGAVLAMKGLGDAFTDAALEAKKMSEATGLTVESSSEWIAAADDVGLSAGTLEGAFGKAVKAIGMAPDKFAALGIELAHTKDGAIDMNGTLLNSIDVINGIQDPTKKAALASQLYGKSWQELTPLLEQGSDAVRDTMAATSDAQRITDAEVESAKEWQAVMDDLGDTMVDLKMSAGKLVVEGFSPILESMAQTAQDMMFFVGIVEKATAGLIKAGEAGKFMWENFTPPGQIGRAIGLLRTGAEGLGTAWDSLTGSGEADVVVVKKVTDAHSAYGRAMFNGTEAVQTQAEASALATERAKELAAEVKASADAERDRVSALEASTAALLAQNDTMRGLTDSRFAYNEAARDGQEAVEGLDDAVKAINDSDATAAEKQREIAQLYDDTTVKLIDQAGAQQKLAEDTALSAGATLSATAKLDTYNASLVASASATSGPVRDAIIQHIADVNGIPPEKVTEILAQTPNLEEQKRLLDEASKARTATIKADADTVQASLELDRLAQTRDVLLRVRTSEPIPRAGGGIVSEALTLLGERGPELVALPSGSYVFTAEETRRMKAGGMAAGGYINQPTLQPPPGGSQPWLWAARHPVTSTSGTAGAINNSTYRDAQGRTSWTVPVTQGMPSLPSVGWNQAAAGHDIASNLANRGVTVIFNGPVVAPSNAEFGRLVGDALVAASRSGTTLPAAMVR